ncbi:Pb-reticulocyte-binding protein [Brunnivagina elsteri]|uniref:Pb-reticulocyte-binding protein n=1 Tax=Brunnivagina elsteri CCALA 953 TaxID=987040 RepID=A0A2A2THW6_9CYAN|nr:Pb-reticulocyte-binding protein [Calothrix elsteri]PAX53397.1 Pb-reticulocyte-binding protein [Calothrix elsteri CCALA 953]
MVQAISTEQAFITNLEHFMTKADKFIKTYYSGVSEENHVREIVHELQNLVSDTDLQQLEIDYEYQCDIKDLIADCDDSTWF